jgi:hypothetical protein
MDPKSTFRASPARFEYFITVTRNKISALRVEFRGSLRLSPSEDRNQKHSAAEPRACQAPDLQRGVCGALLRHRGNGGVEPPLVRRWKVVE